MLAEEITSIKKEEDIDDMQKIWLDAQQEKQLSMILDKSKGWEKLIDYFNYTYLMKTCQQSSSNPALLLLNYIAVRLFFLVQRFLRSIKRTFFQRNR